MFDGFTKHSVVGSLVLLSALLPQVATAADEAVDPKIAKNITISGCLHAGERSRQFVLVGVTEKTPAGDFKPVPYAIYILDSTRDMKELVGEMVDIKGVVVSKDSKNGTIKVAVSGDSVNTTDVEVGTTKDSSTTTKGFAGAAGGRAAESVVEVSRPVYRIGVESIVASGDRNASGCK